MTKHTAGPWKIMRNVVDNDIAIIGNNYLLAEVFEKVLNDKLLRKYEVGANARLIAAAPDLLAACEVARITLNQCGCEHNKELWSELSATHYKLTAAIEKAKGDA